MLTIFTPTYNREYTIGRLHESLRAQTSKDFEWIVVNDGSTDRTSERFREWTAGETEFPIRYLEVPNGGKHRAINLGITIAESQAFFIVDSDDYLLPNAVKKAQDWFGTIAEDPAFAGCSGLKGVGGETIEPVGGYGMFEGEFVDCTNLERHLYHLLDDKAEIYKTEMLRAHPFPEFEGENFVPESLVWDWIARDGYKIRWFNEIIYICEYLEDGLTASANRKFLENPKGFLAYLAMLETVHDVRGVNVFRLQYYRDLIENYGTERAMEVIRIASDLGKYGENATAKQMLGMN